MSREAERWNIDLGVENRGFRKATRAGQPKEGSRMRLPEEVSKKREVTSSPVAEFRAILFLYTTRNMSTRINLDLDTLRALSVVHDLGILTQAAEHLGRTPSTISLQIPNTQQNPYRIKHYCNSPSGLIAASTDWK
jgi:hypothetical protein